MLEEIWAKSNPQESLAEHTDAVVNNLLALKERYFEYLPDEVLWKEAFIAALFHDLGKICENFQDMIQPARSIERENIVRHEFISGMFLLVSDIPYYRKNPLSLFAVFSHHKALTSELFSERRFIELKIQERYLDEFIEYAKLWLGRISEIEFNFNKHAKLNLQNRYEILVGQYENQFFKLTRELRPRHRTQYIYQKALLNIADWTASGHRRLELGLTFDASFLEKKIIEKLRNEGKENVQKKFQYLQFQKESMVQGNVLAVAPTGSGKTEAALLWASQKKEFEHIFYLLPTRVTSNAIFTRLCTYFDSEKIAIVHSSAFFFQKEIDENYPEKEYAFIDKAFFKNITVCTIDQILTQGFNLGFWEVKTFHQLNAYVIIDEIHLYEPYTLGLIIATINYLQDQFNTRFYIMTATMPSRLKQLLAKHLNEPTIISDEELLEKARNIFEIRKCEFEGIKDEIVGALLSNKKVLLVLNTVNAAIQAFEYFKEIFPMMKRNILCYHSRFIQKDRSKKEKEIFRLEQKEEAVLLVATQVVEVSLDIDFDILFSENAPIDAIIQRAGRVNRKRKKKGTKIVVFQHSEVAQKYVYKVEGLLERTFTILARYNKLSLTEKQLLDIVDEVYQKFDIEEDENFRNGLKRYALIQKDLNYILDQRGNEEVFTRLGLNTINVIPNKFKELLMGEGIMEKTKHEVSISRKNFQSLKNTEEDSQHPWFKYVDVIYDFETGLKFKSKKDSNNPTSGFY